jgi:enediyne biosynthesis protein E4
MGFAVALTVVLLAGCGRDAPAGGGLTFAGHGWFEDVTGQVGLDFVHDAGPTDGSYFMPQSLGAGAALFDFNNDGLLDILLLQSGGPDSPFKNRLYQQLPDGHFKDVSAGSGLDFAGYNMGVAIGDVNNDGLPDVLITQFGGVKLFLNQGGGKFKDVTKEAGLDVPGWATSAAFFDYDRDGYLDLVVACYIDYDRTWPCGGPSGAADYCDPRVFKGTVSKLFHNRGHNVARSGDHATGGDHATMGSVRFEDVTLASGLGRLPGPGLGVVCADFDGDGWPDIFIADDGQPNRLWINQKNGTFKDEAVKRGVAYNAMGAAEANMGVAWGDVDGDLLGDLFVTHLTHETNTLWKQGPRGLFRDETQFTQLGRPRWRGTGFGTVLGDFDNHGALDAAVVNGRVARGEVVAWSPDHATTGELAPFWRPYAERNQLFANDGSGRFQDVSTANAAFCKTPRVSRGLAVGGVFNDGSLALLTTEIGGPARLYRNIASDRGHWLEVRAVDPALRRDAYGAEIIVQAGGKKWVRWINPAGSFLCSSDPRAHFGFGRVDKVDAIEILWPDGREEEFDGGPADRLRVLRRGEGRVVEKRP